jgi:LAS superfamily LD-carboxypeptidase LdcB
MILVICVGIYMLFKPSEAPVPSTSTNSFTGSSSYEIPTPPPGQVSESMTNVPDFLPSPPIFQVPNDADITPQLPNKSFERSLSSSKSIKSQPPTHFAYLENKQNLVEVGSYYNRTAYLTLEAATAFKKMKLAATEVGIKLTPISLNVGVARRQPNS